MNPNQALPVSLTIEDQPGHEITIADSIRRLHPDLWDACLLPDNLFMRRAYLEALEQSKMPGLRSWYALIHHDSVPHAALYFQLINLSSRELGGVLNLDEYGGLATGIADRINKMLFHPANGKNAHLLVCGSLLVSGSYGIASRSDAGIVDAAKAIPAIKAQIARMLPATDRVVGFMVKDFYGPTNTIVAPYFRKEYFPLNTDPEMILEVLPAWRDFEDYLAALSSKYRIRANQALSKLGGIEVKSLTLEEIIRHRDSILQLNQQVVQKAPVRLIHPSADYFSELKSACGDRYILNAFFDGPKMIAFTSGLYNRDHFEAHFIGIDYSYNRTHCLYQNILYRYIRDAIAVKSKRLFYGRTALEIKSTVGAEPHPLSCYFRFSNRILNTLARPLVSAAGTPTWIPRNPFRQ